MIHIDMHIYVYTIIYKNLFIDRWIGLIPYKTIFLEEEKIA